MGGGSYNVTYRSTRAKAKGYDTLTKATMDTVFKQNVSRSVHETLNPKGVSFREARDSDEHPESYPILIGVDVTGSMGDIPVQLAKNGLPNMIQRVFNQGIKHPQVGFVAFGDHEVDGNPLQISQFESSDELIDECLTNIYFEGGGGGNGGESYLLAWYHAAHHTKIDSYEKRGQKGLLVTIGDEPNLSKLPGRVVSKLYGMQSSQDFTASELLTEASKTYDVYHINVGSTYSGSSQNTKDHWRQTLGQNFIEAQSHEEIPEIIGKLAARCYEGACASEGVMTQPATPEEMTKPDPVIL